MSGISNNFSNINYELYNAQMLSEEKIPENQSDSKPLDPSTGLVIADVIDRESTERHGVDLDFNKITSQLLRSKSSQLIVRELSQPSEPNKPLKQISVITSKEDKSNMVLIFEDLLGDLEEIN